MQVMYERCAGIDVHQRFLVVCLSIVEAGQRRKEIRTFRNETADLRSAVVGRDAAALVAQDVLPILQAHTGRP